MRGKNLSIMKNTYFMFVFIFLIGAQYNVVHGSILTPVSAAAAGARANPTVNGVAPPDASSYGRRCHSTRNVVYFTRTNPGSSERGPGHR
ncbi:hypothetical protein RND71_038338 [Anisodus tanguticus]|uniref:Uncharacterized protein n=1 Tax=Anisodus tanguticus TaxID=243964 RepID=A0AAE1R213_9SOLA|nr:hypothetical protein RND71_038338 [Anisodus tanguticus]